MRIGIRSDKVRPVHLVSMVTNTTHGADSTEFKLELERHKRHASSESRQYMVNRWNLDWTGDFGDRPDHLPTSERQKDSFGVSAGDGLPMVSGMGCGLFKTSSPKTFEQQRLSEHGGKSINCMALSEDGSLLVAGSDDCRASLWSTQCTPIELLNFLEGHTSYITCCDILQQYVLTGSGDMTLRKWSIHTGFCLGIYEGHEGKINRILAMGSFLFSAASDRTARAWNLDRPQPDTFAVDTLEAIQIFQGHRNGIFDIIFVPSDDNPYKGLRIHKDDLVVTAAADYTARSWSLKTGKCLHVFKGHLGPVSSVAADPDGKSLYTAGADGTIRVWNLQTGTCNKTLKGHQGPIYALQLSHRMLFTGSSDRQARSWVVEFGECTRIYRGHKLTVTCLKYSNSYLYTGSGDKIARMFEAKSGALKRTFRGHEHAINCLEAVRGKLITGSSDGTMRVWDTKGVKDETVFGDAADSDSEEEVENDSDVVKKAVNQLDAYIER